MDNTEQRKRSLDFLSGWWVCPFPHMHAFTSNSTLEDAV